MQQTENLNLNIIEMSDTFSPEPLNKNMEKVEAAIQAVADRSYNPDNKPYVIGAYIGNGSTQTFELGFRPSAVIIGKLVYNNSGDTALGMMSIHIDDGQGRVLKITDTGFTLDARTYTYPRVNGPSTYYYLALR